MSDPVVIVGGGVAGCATALALLQRGVRDVTIIEAGPAAPFRIGESLPPAAADPLRRLGLWEDFLAQAHLPSDGSASSWGKDDLGYNDFFFDPRGVGWHLDRRRFDTLLSDTAEHRGARLLRGHRLRSLERDEAGWRLGIEGPDGASERKAGFLIDASGVGAAAARRLGVARNEVDCLTVTHGLFELADPEAVPARTFLEAAEAGWWYAARLPGGRMIAAFAADRTSGALVPAAWAAAWQATRHIGPAIRRGRPLDEAPGITTSPAASAILSRVVGSDWLAVGDAACSYDPLTSHGIVKALQDGELAAAAISASHSERDATLAAYQKGVFTRFTDYLRLRHHLYGLEHRWPDAPFWRRPLTRRQSVQRHQPSSLGVHHRAASAIFAG